MQTRLKLALWLELGAVALALGISAIATPSAEAAHPESAAANAARVCIAPRSGGGAQGWHPAALALVLASAPDPEKALGDLEQLIEQLEESVNPMALGLDPPDASEQKRLVAALWPSVTAAQALLS